MPSLRPLHQRVSSYADREPWERAHEEAQSCFDIEERMSWGLRLFRGLMDLDSQIQARGLESFDAEAEQHLDSMVGLYRCWLGASEFYLERAKSFVGDDHEVDGLEEFEAAVEEARCLTENLALEAELPPIEELRMRVQPHNPRPDRYGD